MKKEQTNAIATAIPELEYNCQMGVGTAEMPFKIDGIAKLSNPEVFDKDINHHAKEIAHNAHLCYRRPIKFNPGSIKSHCQALLNMLKEKKDVR